MKKNKEKIKKLTHSWHNSSIRDKLIGVRVGNYQV
jgi:hypothetical protein